MKLPFFLVDTFSEHPFSGNPAVVLPLEHWLSDNLLEALARELMANETAFIVPRQEIIEIRWFTPEGEVEFCGHSTLAAAHVVLREWGKGPSPAEFHSKAGPLWAEERDSILMMDFPAQKPEPIPLPEGLASALGAEPLAVFQARDLLVLLQSEEEVRELFPNFRALGSFGNHGIIATAQGEDTDFVSRFFAPELGIPEDAVSGSAHCSLTPFWSHKLGKNLMRARQVSRRGGELYVEDRGDRVGVGGRTVKTIEGTFHLDARILELF